MSELKNPRFIDALLKKPIDRTPVWMMRQAGRYLPEYRALRAEVPSFMDFCRRPELACEVTLQPLRRFALDAAIIFSDILTVPDAMGMDLEFIAGEGPVMHNPIRSLADVDALTRIDVENELGYVRDAVALTVKELDGNVPLIGFAGSPWTVATYMVEGGSSKIFKNIKTMLYRDPDTLHALLQSLTDVTINYLNMQIRAGARAVQIFDSWGGVLTGQDYKNFSLTYMQQIAEGLLHEHDGNTIPVIFFTKGGGQWLEQMAAAECDALGLDWTTDLSAAKARVGDQVALQGNLDPFTLFGNESEIRERVRNIMQAYKNDTGFVFNLGHGIDKDTPIENVEIMLDAVQSY